MRNTIIILLFPFIASSQTIVDGSGNIINYTKVSDVKAKTDSLALALSNSNTAALATKQNVITVLPFANGGISGAASTSATTGTINVSMTTSVITCTPSGNLTLNATGGVAGQRVTFAITTSGVTSFTITFGSNFRKVSTLVTGTTTARFFAVTFICIDGLVWMEISRTAAQT